MQKSTGLKRALRKARAATQQGNREVARQIYSEILSRFPGHVLAQQEFAALGPGPAESRFSELAEHDLLQQLAGLLSNNQFSEVCSLIEQRATPEQLTGNLAAVHGIASFKIERLEASKASFQFALEHKLTSHWVREELAEALLAIDRSADALSVLGRGLELFPTSAHLHHLAGNAWKRSGDYVTAIQSYRTAVGLQPNDAHILSNLATALASLSKFQEALIHAKRSIELEEGSAELFYNLGNIYQWMGDSDEAIINYERSLEIDATAPDSHTNLANAYKMSGRGQKAVDHYSIAWQLRPNDYRILNNLVTTKAYRADEKFFQRLQTEFSNLPQDDIYRSDLAFAIFRVAKELNEYEKGLDYLHIANGLRKQILKYSFEKDEELFTALRGLMRCSSSKRSPDYAPSDFQPIFVVGMPRSGTSLLEQIIAAHSKVEGLGELGFVSQIMSIVMNKSRPSLNSNTVRSQYHRLLEEAYGSVTQFTDKMPTNFLYLPMLVDALPEAKFVHIYRQPQATCWSMYESQFTGGGLGFSYCLEDLKNYYNHYVGLMANYDNELKDRIFHVEYESLTDKPAAEIPRLMDYLELPMEPDVLSPHTNKRGVATASSEQVRQPIYRDSSKAWLAFEPWLEGKLDNIKNFDPF